jgi:hypothetical protein
MVMKRIYSFLIVIIFAAIFSPAFSQKIMLTVNVKKALDVVDTAEIKADIKYLADDKLKGRAPGTEGYQMAVDYVISREKELGVKPAGENGGWLQTVKLRKSFVKENSLSLSGSNYSVTKSDYIIYPNPANENVKVFGGLVFAGYGISEPKLGYDDYAGIDVKGKIVIVTRGTPDKFSSSVAAHVANSTQILKVAAQHGAIGVIMGSQDSTARMPNLSRGIFSVLDENGNVVISRIYYSNQVSVYGSFGYKLFNVLLQQAGKAMPTVLAQLKSGTPNSFAIDAGANIGVISTFKDIISYNVIGKIEGTDPKLKNEYVVHSAHLDHLGIGPAVQGDSIYNGAHDNASGVASVLAIAKIYKNIDIKPKRSILTVLMTGEELGDLGSGYFAKHPTVKVGSMVADVNTDMPTIIAPLLSITALGAEHSSLATQVAEAAGYLDISVEPDPEPKQARFTRSDQYSFVLQGIPALHVKYGNKTADGKNNLADFVAPWRAKYYHKPQDDINGIFDFAAGKKYAQLNFLIGYLVAQDDARPTWNAGDIFATN